MQRIHARIRTSSSPCCCVAARKKRRGHVLWVTAQLTNTHSNTTTLLPGDDAFPRTSTHRAQSQAPLSAVPVSWGYQSRHTAAPPAPHSPLASQNHGKSSYYSIPTLITVPQYAAPHSARADYGVRSHTRTHIHSLTPNTRRARTPCSCRSQSPDLSVCLFGLVSK